MKIAISGKMCSGKSSFANKIIDKLGPENPSQTISFAAKLKELAAELFNYDEKKNKNRKLLQDFGAALKSLDNDVWIRALHKQVLGLPSQTNVIIDDLRFPDELAYCQQNGFITIRLEISPNIQKGRIISLYNPEHLERIGNISETALDSYLNNFNYVINTDDFSKVESKIDQILKQLK